MIRGLVRPDNQYAPGMTRLGPAGGSFQHCLNQAANHNGEPPTCTRGPDGSWVASWPDGPSSSGFAGGFVLLVLVALALGVGITIWKVSTARRLASQSGMSPGLATQMTLLTDNGLDATYLAASLRPPQGAPVPTVRTVTTPPDPAAPAPIPKSAAERLTELGALRDQGLITDAEYDARRRSIIDDV